MFPPAGSVTQPPLILLLHTHSLPDCLCVMHYPPALCSGRISYYLTCLLPLTASPHLCIGNLTCSLSLKFASACSLPDCSLPGFPLQRLPHFEFRLCSPAKLPDSHLFGLLNIVNKVLNCAGLDLCCSSVHSHTRYTWYLM